jgi:two-component system, OmpR family, phosphate regulon sensor histidine kinase PhoR
MRMIVSFRMRFFVTLVLVFGLLLLLPLSYYSRVLRQQVLAEDQTRALRLLRLVHWQLQQNKGILDAEHLQEVLAQTGSRLGVRVTYMAAGGRVIADSDVPFADLVNLENHANRPEIIAARSQDVGISMRYSGTVQKELLYVATSVERVGAIPAGVLRLALPFSGVRERLERESNLFLALVVLLLAAGVLASVLLARSLKRAVGSMAHAVDTIGKGDFKFRLRSSYAAELLPLVHSLNQMTERIEARTQTVLDQKQQLEAILNGMQEGVMLLDARGKIHTVNRALRAMAPSVTQIIGRRPLEVIMSPELQEACDQLLAAVPDQALEPRSLHIELHWQRHYEVNLVRVQDQQRGLGAIIVLHDISELKRLEKVRQDFVSNVSHELRTPLTSIKGYAETLLADAEQDPDAARSFLQVILKNANHMVKMVNDLLELARMETHVQSLAFTSINLLESLAAAWKVCAPLATDKQIQLDNQIPASGLWVQADNDQLFQVFCNLLENAIKFSPPGESVTVSAQIEEEIVTVAVRDRGPGIPKPDQQRIFERFYRVDRHRRKYPGSTGLGLAICRHIIRNHGGRIWVESATTGEDHGATFYFTLPLGAADTE